MESNTVKSVEVKLLGEKTEEIHVKAYKRRWFIMLVYMYYACFASVGWIEYSSMTNIVVKYYNVSTLAVDWTSIIYMVTFAVLIIPASLVMEKEGLRISGLIGCIGTFVGTALKVLSIRHDLFWIVVIGQIIMSIAQVFIIVLPSKIASVWFKSSEISTACSLGVLGSISGNALGYIIPTMVVHQSENMDDVGSELKLLCWILTILMVPVTAAVIFYFPKQPPLPPSTTEAERQIQQKEFNTIDYFRSMKEMFQNKPFMIHTIAYSINVAVLSAVGTLLSQFVLQYFEGATEEAGRMGFFMVIAGLIAIFLFGIIMDKTRKYKECALISYFLSAVSIVLLMCSLSYRSKVFTYITCCLLGFFNNGYMPIGFELGVELTFPSQEITTTSIITAFSQIIGTVVTVAVGHINLWVGSFWALGVQAALLFLGTVITAFIPNRMLRQEAMKSTNNSGDRKTYSK